MISVVDRYIYVCIFLVQMTRQYGTKMKKVVWFLKQVGTCLSLYVHNPETSASKYTPTSNYPDGLRIRPSSNLPFRYWPMCSSDISWEILGKSTKFAHALTSYVTSGRECPCIYRIIPITLAYLQILFGGFPYSSLTKGLAVSGVNLHGR